MSNPASPLPFDDRDLHDLTAALLVLAKSNYDLLSAKTAADKVDIRKMHQDIFNALFGNR